MAYFADLSRETQVARAEWVRAIGWLAAEHSYSQGQVSREFEQALMTLQSRGDAIFRVLKWWPALMGYHSCEFCGAHSATGEIAIPAGELVYIAPKMIGHYISFHQYAPPAEFIHAVLACPSADTDNYANALRLAVGADATEGPARQR